MSYAAPPAAASPPCGTSRVSCPCYGLCPAHGSVLWSCHGGYVSLKVVVKSGRSRAGDPSPKSDNLVFHGTCTQLLSVRLHSRYHTQGHVAVAATATVGAQRACLVAMAASADAPEPWKAPVPTPSGEVLASHRLTRLLPSSYAKAVPRQMEERLTRVIAGLDFALESEPVHRPGMSVVVAGACGGCSATRKWAGRVCDWPAHTTMLAPPCVPL